MKTETKSLTDRLGLGASSNFGYGPEFLGPAAVNEIADSLTWLEFVVPLFYCGKELDVIKQRIEVVKNAAKDQIEVSLQDIEERVSKALLVPKITG